MADTLPEPDPRRASQSLGAWLCMGLPVLIGLTLDLWTKALAVERLRDRPPIDWAFGLLRFQLTFNRGAVFGLGQGYTFFFVAASLLAVGMILYLFWSLPARQRVMPLALGLILAGALGNLYDRAFNGGLVRDFIFLLPAYPRIWPWIFNLADVMLCLGVPLLMLCWIFPPSRKLDSSARPIR